MTSKKKTRRGGTNKKKWFENLDTSTKHSILAVFSITLAVFFMLASFGEAGVVGSTTYSILQTLFGAGFFLVPTVFFLAAIPLISSFRPHFLSNTAIGIILFLISGLGAADVMFGAQTGGYIGYFMSWPLIKLFDFWVSLIILTALFVVSLLVMLNTSINIKIKTKEKPEGAVETVQEHEEEDNMDDKKEVSIPEKIIAGAKGIASGITDAAEAAKKIAKSKKVKPTEQLEESDEEEMQTLPTKTHTQFIPPPIKLVEGDKGKPSSGDIKASANIIKRSLQNFGINVEMGEINVGPSVTQYTLKPAEGIKLSRILALQNDLSLALAAHPIRIEAPIPGRSLVGIELPNTAKTIVGLAGMFSDKDFAASPAPLLLALGRDVSGKSIFSNLCKMPHLLIAGATGSGKSIAIHSIIISLLYKNSPETMRIIMIDPKRVELTIYNKIPHMLTPVITEAKKAILALKWACKEMDRRYELLLKAGVRDIASYHEKFGEAPLDGNEDNRLPYMIIVIDELADIMATYPREMEASIVRLAQMSRAVGIHLIVSTQRPSVEVITGLIKANITSRIALQVASQIDSRTILDMSGAEKLLGNGDMLFLSGDSAKPRRLQGPFISEMEIKRVVKYLAEEYKGVSMDSEDDIEGVLSGENDPLSPSSGSQSAMSLDFDEEEDGDELYEDARDMIIKTEKASASFLQRKFKIGYARAARLLDILEERGVVGPSEGAKPRKVYIKEKKEGEAPSDFVNYEENKVDF